jgi:hypothetical protein
VPSGEGHRANGFVWRVDLCEFGSSDTTVLARIAKADESVGCRNSRCFGLLIPPIEQFR